MILDRIPSWVTITATVVMAFPFGWGVGVLLAYLVAGRDFGQLPIMTVPVGMLGAIVFALWPSVKPSTRLLVVLGGTAVFVLVGLLAAS